MTLRKIIRPYRLPFSSILQYYLAPVDQKEKVNEANTPSRNMFNDIISYNLTREAVLTMVGDSAGISRTVWGGSSDLLIFTELDSCLLSPCFTVCSLVVLSLASEPLRLAGILPISSKSSTYVTRSKSVFKQNQMMLISSTRLIAS